MSLTRYFSGLLSTLVFPHNCCGCGHHLSATDQVLCWRCIRELPLTGFEQHGQNPVANIFAGRLPLQQAASLLFFVKESLTQQLLHQLKYKGRQDVGHYLGRRMGVALLNAGWEVDGIVPVPLNRIKEARRGYNQAAVLADGIGVVLQKPVWPVAVVRTRNNATQTRKNRVARWENVNEVFDLRNEQALQGKRVLLVDDVVTTGATLEACGQILLGIPDVQLYIATAAYASKV